MLSLFIGVVSHPSTRFAVSQGPEGLAARLAGALEASGIDTTVVVNTADRHDDVARPVTDDVVQACLTEQVRLDRRWARYLGRARGTRWWIQRGLRWIRRAEQWVRRPDPATVRRLLNIELSHLELLRAGLEAGAAWVLILEDDAASSDPAEAAAGLAGLMRSGSDQPAYVNLSLSFSNAELGIEHLLTPLPATWAGSPERCLLAAERPVTNTVCAILYRGSFVADLVEAMDALPMEPVVPIDWKLNLALMEMFASGRLRAGDCWMVEPPPIAQMSMSGKR
ncbi:MAG: hypothetical protein ACYC2Z_00885 [Candidatus Nanopelagicales bacterium]